jgi:hypothetical protein
MVTMNEDKDEEDELHEGEPFLTPHAIQSDEMGMNKAGDKIPF